MSAGSVIARANSATFPRSTAKSTTVRRVSPTDNFGSSASSDGALLLPLRQQKAIAISGTRPHGFVTTFAHSSVNPYAMCSPSPVFEPVTMIVFSLNLPLMTVVWCGYLNTMGAMAGHSPCCYEGTTKPTVWRCDDVG